MRRRDFIILFGGGAAAWPLVGALAQSSNKIWRMGFIQELGYTEGRNLTVERRYAGDDTQQFQEFAAEMVRLNVDIIIVVTTPAALPSRKRPRPSQSCSPTLLIP